MRRETYTLGDIMKRNDRDGRTPLHNSILCMDHTRTEELLKSQKDIDTPDADGFTPLHLAIVTGNMNAATALVERRANPDAESSDDKGRRTPLHLLASECGRDESENTVRASLVKTLVANGADANHPDAHGQSPLHKAARCGNASMAAALINAGASVNAKDDNGNTPLHVAAASGVVTQLELTGLLLKHGAQRDARDHEGRTPDEVALEHDCPQVARMIRDAARGTSRYRDR